MLRQGADPENLDAADFLCNFCGRSWSDDNPMIEGHQGSLICAKCLTVAYAEVGRTSSAEGADEAGKKARIAPDDRPKCILCLEHRDEPAWRSPVAEDQYACRRCVRQGATTLERDPDSNWKKPA